MIIGPWRDRSWLPAWVGIESIPDNTPPRSRTDDVLACGLRDRALPVGLRLKAPGSKSKHYAKYNEAVEWAQSVLTQLPTDVRMGVGHGVAPYEVVTSPVRAIEVIAGLHARPFSFDLETNSLDPYKVSRVGLSLADDKQSYWIVDTATSPSVMAKFNELLYDQRAEPRASNAKYDMGVLSVWSKLDLTRVRVWDTQVMHWLLDVMAFQHGLKYLARKYIGNDVLELDDVGGPLKFWDMPYDVQATYAAAGDARNSFDLVELFKPMLVQDRLLDTYTQIEQPVIPVLAEMELMGLHIDRQVVFDVAAEFSAWADDIRRELGALGFHGNPNADEHLRIYLYDECKLPVLVQTAKTKRGSVAMDVLRRLYLLRESNPAVTKHARELELFMEWSECDKALSTFILPVLEQRGVDVLRTNFLQTSTKTPRLASRPNVQNWPAHGRRARLREMVTPFEGMAMGLVDLSQIEPRLGAHYSQDPKLLADFRAGKDVYASIGRDMGFSEEELTKHHPRRQNMKTVYLAWQYRTSPQKIQEIALRQGTWLPLDEAVMYHRGMTAARPDYVRWQGRLIEQARRNKEVRALFGHRRSTWGLDALDPATRAATEREVVNFPNQAGAGGMIKGAMPGVQALCKQAGGGLWNQIHDELDWYVGPMTASQRAEFEHEVRKAMLWYELSVPLEVEYGWGNNWRECK